MKALKEGNHIPTRLDFKAAKEWGRYPCLAEARAQIREIVGAVYAILRRIHKDANP